MTSVWKRLQRVNKRAAKFQFTASYHRIDLEITPKWKPNKLSVVWARRSRRVIAEPLEWEPSMMEPLKGSAIWAMPDNHTIAVTLFRDPRTNELEDKDWIFILEDVSTSGRRRRIAQAPLNLCNLATAGPSQHSLSIALKPSTTKVTSASLELTVSCVLLREGSAADEDMQSMASIMSVNNNSDIAALEDFEDDDISENSASLKQMLDLTQQMELMTSSLAGTPAGIPSLDATPTTSIPLDALRISTTEDVRNINTLSNPFEKVSTKGPHMNSQTPRSIFEPMTFTGTKVHLSKKNLKPLELKTNLNDYPYSEDIEEIKTDSITPVADIDKDKTPVISELNKNKLSRESSREDSVGREPAVAQDLLEWCQQVTKDYPQCNVTNFTSSWTDGMAFCALIHHFRPDLIDMSQLNSEDAENNIRIALKASEVLGIPGVFHASEMRRSRGPDRLALITYLHQLRALFTHRQLKLQKIGPTSEESSYTIGRFSSDKDTDISVELFSQEILTMRQKRMEQPHTNRTSLSSQDSVDSQNSQERNLVRQTNNQNKMSPERLSNNSADSQLLKDKSPMNAVRDMKGMILSSSKNILGKVLSPTKEKIANMKSPFEKFSFGRDTSSNVEAKQTQPVKEVPEKKEANQVDNSTKNTQPPPPVLGVTVREAWPVKLMTRKQLTDPFGSDEEDEPQDVLAVHLEDSKSKQPSLEMTQQKEFENKQDIHNDGDGCPISPLSPLDSLPKTTQQLLSRHDELKERARQLLEATRREAREKDNAKMAISPTADQNEDPLSKQAEEERKAQLKERARKLIADVRAGSINSPTSPNQRGTVEILSASQVLAEHPLSTGFIGSQDSSPTKSMKSGSYSDSENNIIKRDGSLSPKNNGNGSPLRNFEGGIIKASSPLKTFADYMDRISPDKDSYILRGFGKDMRDYIQSEMEALEREQTAIDQQAALLEKELRAVMDSGQSEAEENALMSKWFTLVNKKNALLRRQMQLNILEQENELRQRHAKVDNELRELLGVEEWCKSEGQRGREARLLSELLSVVDARDQLVHHLHEHEQAIEDDDEIERNLSNVELQRKNNCSIQ